MNYKKDILFLVLVMATSLKADVTRHDEIKRSIISNNTRIFDTRVFKETFSQGNVTTWHQILNDVQNL